VPTAATNLKYLTFDTTPTSGANWPKKFAVVMGTLIPTFHKNQTVRRTPEGALDITEGPITTQWQMTVRCHRVPTTADVRGATYGTYADLISLFGQKNPRGSPSNLIAMVDHLSVAHSVYMTGDLPIENITPVLDGDESVYFIPLVLEEA